MIEKLKNINFSLFAFFFIVCSTLIFFHPGNLNALEKEDTVLIEKIAKSYTNKFCNSIGFGLSKDSAMKFSIKENNEVFKKKKGFKKINKELLAEEIAISVIDKCGYPIEFFGEEGILEFKNYYLSKDKELS